MSPKYADIIIDISHEAIDRPFQYKIPDELIDSVGIGTQVMVPFGRYNSRRTGYVIALTETPSYDESRIKVIEAVTDKGLQIEGKLIRLAAWMHETYGSTMINALKTVMPVREKIKKGSVAETIRYDIDKAPVLTLNHAQQKLVDEFTEDCHACRRRTYLLHGVTGSGKTEVYIGCIREVIKNGGQAIVLIPEIGLTYQNVARFEQHFGDRVALMHSRLSKGEKYEIMQKAKKHEVDVIIGPRSALFAPCDRLGLIIVDEEHDSAYKSDLPPKYHARETAIERADLEDASVILGSATPTVESYAFAGLGIYRLWELKDRPDGMELPTVSVVDLRQELHHGNRSIISEKLRELIEDRLSKHEQIMLFINRRGYNSFVSCRECGEPVKCPRCDVALALHANGFMQCHYCGYMIRAPKECPSCKSHMIGGFGTGTERVETEIKKLFPKAVTLRMDKDTTTKKGSHGVILDGFRRGKADILIGTQMIVKGHDFDNVTLVGIMLADLSLFANDFRAGERTFDLITQASGRAGRGTKRGDVVIQTYQPEHYAIVTASRQAYGDFFDMEMAYRRLLKYPPVYNMMVVLITSEEKNLAIDASQKLAGGLKQAGLDMDRVRVIGPGDASVSRINGLYRRVIYIKSYGFDNITKLRQLVDAFTEDGVGVSVDVNPVTAY